MNLLEHPVFAGLELRDGRAKLADVTLHYVEAGPVDGPLAILLHGFPEFWFSWRRQIVALANAGFRVAVPDLRGYNTSDKPKNVSDYGVSLLAKDVKEFIESLGEEAAFLAGHDWGAVVAWQVKMEYPEVAKRLVILNVPHPVRMSQGLRTLKQIRKSWYIFAFQLPFAERSIRKNDYAVVRKLFRNDPVSDDAFTPEEIDAYVDAIAQPGALTAALNYYRAAARAVVSYKPTVIDDEVLVLWGEKDTALGKELAKPPQKWVPNHTVIRFPNASHWVQNDAWEDVNKHLIEHWS